MKKILLILAILFPTNILAIEFTGKFIQGHYILGKTDSSSQIIIDKKIIKVLSKQFGSQSIAVTLNINTFDNNSYLINDTVYSKECDFKSIIKEISQEGAGEIIINCIHRDGTNSGYDIKLIDMIYPHATTPLTFVGGANSYDHILELAKKYPLLGLGAGNLFIYKGKNKAVLISYPSEHSER